MISCDNGKNKECQKMNESKETGQWVRIRGVCTPGGDPYYECSNCGHGRCYGVEYPEPLELVCPYCACKMVRIIE